MRRLISGCLSLCAGIGAVLTAGCVDSAEEVDAAGLRAAFLYSIEQAYELEVVQNRLYRACMETKGWTEHDLKDPPRRDEYNGFFLFNPRPSPEEAREVGYSRSYMFGREPELVNQPSWDQDLMMEYWNDLGGEGYAEEIFGLDPETEAQKADDPPDERDIRQQQFPEGGCIGEVVNEVYGSHDALLEYLDLEYAATSLAPVSTAAEDVRVIEVETTWRECMSEAGYEFDSPLDAELAAHRIRTTPSDPETYYDTEISQEEADQAYSDALCNVEVGLDETRFAVLWEYMDQFVADHEADYKAFDDAAERYQERAVQLLEDGRW